jgi:hypothetical protein
MLNSFDDLLKKIDEERKLKRDGPWFIKLKLHIRDSWWATVRFIKGTLFNWGRGPFWHLGQFIERGRYGCNDADSWSLDSYLLRVKIRGLKKLREREFGYPMYVNDVDGNEMMQLVSWRDEEEEGHSEYSMAIWKSILTDMIDGFDAKIKIDEGWYEGDEYHYPHQNEEEYKELNNKFNTAMGLYVHNFGALWD